MSVSFEAPGPGGWRREPVHFPGTTSPPTAAQLPPTMAEGLRTAFARYGLPVSHMELRMVNHVAYARLMPAFGGEAPRTAPPPFVLKVLTRVHPTLRARVKAAAHAFDTRLWREDRRQWEQVTRPAREAANRALQAVDPADLDDAGLARHLLAVDGNAKAGNREHFELVGADIAIGDFIVTAAEAGLDSAEALDLLAGTSPASAASAAAVQRIADELAAVRKRPATLDGVRKASPGAAAALDAYLDEFGWHLVSDFDITGQCLVELPDVVMNAIKARRNPPPPTRDRAALEAEVLARVPVTLRSRFLEGLEEARSIYGLRDENVAVTSMWPMGLLRRAYLEAGRRLSAAGRLRDRDHVFELLPTELATLVVGGDEPDADDVADRASARAEAAGLAPETLGPPDPPPPDPSILPPAMARATRAILAYAANHFGSTPTDRLPPSGVGVEPYTGRACVVQSPEEAMARIEPGDVLVTTFTTPAYNAVLPLLGAIVVEEGGQLCHAAIVARELGIPAIVGYQGATQRLPDGATLTVDPARAEVRVG